MNVLGSREILADLFGIPSVQLVQFLAEVPERSKVNVVQDSPTREVVKEPDLGELPILTHFKGDAGAYITGGIVVAELDGVSNASFHRMLVLNEKRLAARLVPSRHLYKMHREALERGEDLKVGIAIGVDPFILLAASTRVPPGKEFEYASALKNEPIELFQLSNGIAIPHAEFAFEGFISKERATEGPFLDITGTYDKIREEPVITLTRMYHRKDPIYHAILPSGREHRLLMGVPYEPLIFKAVERVARVKNVLLTDGGCCYLHAVVQLRKDKEGEPKNAIIAAFAAHPSLKRVIVVDEDIDIFNQNEVEYAVAMRVRWNEDVVLIPGVKGSSLDPSSKNGLTTKVGLDATKELGTAAKKYERIVKNASSSL
jgi:UbiD family decarboxylase